MNVLKELCDRGLTLLVHEPRQEVNDLNSAPHYFAVVWLYATDDPALGVFQGEGETLEIAVTAALEAWDGASGKLSS